MKTVRAKFVVNHINTFEDGSIQVNAIPVYSGSPENKSFNDATPSGDLRLNISAGKPAQAFFEQGIEYYLDFTRADNE